MTYFPLQTPVSIFLLVLAIILLGPFVFRRLRIPPLVGMILAGIAVGPYGFNLLERDASFKIFGEVGILYIMFQAAVEIDMYHLRQNFKRGLIFGLLSFAIPMVAGIFASRYAFDVGWDTAVLIATMYASHTLISYPVVSKFGLSNNSGAIIAVTGTIVAVMLALLALAQVINVKINGGVELVNILYMLGLTAVYMVAIGYSFPWITRRVFSINNDPITQYIFILALVFLASMVAQLIGLEAILGAFYAGLALNRMVPARSALMRNLSFVGNAIFIPYFLIGVGMLINVRVVFNGWDVAWVIANMIAVALASKWVSVWVSAKIFGLPTLDRRLMFGLTSGKAAATIAATMIGFKYGLLNENIMNGAVIMILACCIVASVFTERAAKRIRMQLTAEDLLHDELEPGEYGRQLVAVANPLTSVGLMRMAMFMRAPGNHHPATLLFVRSNDDTSVAEMGRNALRKAENVAESMEVEVNKIERFDLNIVSGITNVSREQNSTEILIGLHRKSNIVDSFYGSMIEQLIKGTNKMILMSRCFLPVDTVDRICIVVPPKAEYETGFNLWVMRMANLGSQISAKLVFFCHPDTQEFIRTAIDEGKYPVKCDFRTMENWDDFILLSGEVREEDLMVIVSARKGSISAESDFDAMPQFLSKHFSRHNLLLIYPRQF